MIDENGPNNGPEVNKFNTPATISPIQAPIISPGVELIRRNADKITIMNVKIIPWPPKISLGSCAIVKDL